MFRPDVHVRMLQCILNAVSCIGTRAPMHRPYVQEHRPPQTMSRLANCDGPHTARILEPDQEPVKQGGLPWELP